MKKDVIIHIGFPKTATTTIQNTLLLEISKTNDYIHYFQLASLDKQNPNKRSADFARMLRNQGTVFNDYYDIKPGITYISDEIVLMPTPFSAFDDSIELKLKALKKYLDTIKPDSYKIVFSIRNQRDLLYSLGVQRYDYLRSSGYKNIEGFYKANNSFDYNKFFELDYYRLITKIYQLFNKKNVSVLLFEDYLYDKNKYYQDISNAFLIDYHFVKANLENKHFNQKKKSDNGYYGEYKSSIFYMLLKRIAYLPIVSKFRNSINQKQWYVDFRYKLKNKKKQFHLPYMSDELKNEIFKSYLPSNHKMAELLDVDFEKLNRYGYL